MAGEPPQNPPQDLGMELFIDGDNSALAKESQALMEGLDSSMKDNPEMPNNTNHPTGTAWFAGCPSCAGGSESKVAKSLHSVVTNRTTFIEPS